MPFWCLKDKFGTHPRIMPCGSGPGHLISTYPRRLPRRLVLDPIYCMLVKIWPLCHCLTYKKVDYSLGNVPRRLFLQECLSIHVARVMITRISPQSKGEIQHTFTSHLKSLYSQVFLSWSWKCLFPWFWDFGHCPKLCWTYRRTCLRHGPPHLPNDPVTSHLTVCIGSIDTLCP